MSPRAVCCYLFTFMSSLLLRWIKTRGPVSSWVVVPRGVRMDLNPRGQSPSVVLLEEGPRPPGAQLHRCPAPQRAVPPPRSAPAPPSTFCLDLSNNLPCSPCQDPLEPQTSRVPSAPRPPQAQGWGTRSPPASSLPAEGVAGSRPSSPGIPLRCAWSLGSPSNSQHTKQSSPS